MNCSRDHLIPGTYPGPVGYVMLRRRLVNIADSRAGTRMRFSNISSSRLYLRILKAVPLPFTMARLYRGAPTGIHGPYYLTYSKLYYFPDKCELLYPVPGEESYLVGNARRWFWRNFVEFHQF